MMSFLSRSIYGFWFWKLRAQLVNIIRIQNTQVFSLAIDASIISLDNGLFTVWLLNYKDMGWKKVITPGC